MASDTAPGGGALDPEDPLQLFSSEGPEPQPAARSATPSTSMPAAALSDQFREAEIPSSSWRRPRVSRRAWTLSVVFALGWLASFGLNRLFRPSSVEVRPAQTLVVPVEVPRSVLPSAPIDRTESPASAKPAILAQPARGVAPRAAAPPRASAPRPAARSSAPQPVEMGNRPVVRPVAIERDEPAISGLSASLGPPDDGTPVSEPASDKTPAGSTGSCVRDHHSGASRNCGPNRSDRIGAEELCVCLQRA